MRLAQTINVLGDVAMDMMTGDDGDDDRDEDPRSSLPSPDLLRTLYVGARSSKGSIRSGEWRYNQWPSDGKT